MKIVTILLLTGLLLCAGVVLPAAASPNYKITSFEMSPATGDLSPGDEVTAKLVVQMEGSGDVLFPDGHSLEAYTELADQLWTYEIELNGHGDTMTSGTKYLTFGGWELSYPDSNSMNIYYFLEGKAPEVTATGEKIIIRLRQLDSSDNLVSGGEYEVVRTVLNPEDVSALRTVREAELAELRTAIDEKYALGVDTTEAENLYSQADDAIKASRTAGYSSANTLLSEAGTYITEAETALARANVQKMLDEAQVPIDATQGIVTYFIDNRSMGKDSRVVDLKTNLVLVQSDFDDAVDLFNQAEYISAGLKADSVKTKATALYEQASLLKEEIGEGFIPNLSGLLPIVLVIVVIVVIGGIGYVLWSRKSRWDELG